jgi:hypothetical protein
MPYAGTVFTKVPPSTLVGDTASRDREIESTFQQFRIISLRLSRSRGSVGAQRWSATVTVDGVPAGAEPDLAMVLS